MKRAVIARLAALFAAILSNTLLQAEFDALFT
jgi:hypothetical protein